MVFKKSSQVFSKSVLNNVFWREEELTRFSKVWQVFCTSSTKNTMLKTILVSSILIILGGAAHAQKVYKVAYESQADVKLYAVKYESQCDLKVYFVNYESQADEDGKWYWVKYESQADVKVYFVDYESQADLKIYYVEYESQVGWRNVNKRHILYGN